MTGEFRYEAHYPLGLVGRLVLVEERTEPVSETRCRVEYIYDGGDGGYLLVSEVESGRLRAVSVSRCRLADEPSEA